MLNNNMNSVIFPNNEFMAESGQKKKIMEIIEFKF